MKKKKREKWGKRQRKLQNRLAHRNFTSPAHPLLGDLPIEYQIADRTRVLGVGGIGAIHTMVCNLRLPEAINAKVSLLKRHLPYWESDHVLSLCYTVLSGGKPLEDINRLRCDEVYLDALSVVRLPAPSTVGDYLRRYKHEADILDLMEAINLSRVKVWKAQPEAFFQQATIDLDGLICETDAECKEGIDYCAYKRKWGYGPLLVSLAETREALYVVNRPASVASHQGVGPWLDRALNLVGPIFQTVWVRGDTDFSLTEHFDKWDKQVLFIFGYDAMENLVEKAEELPPDAWKILNRPPKYEIQTSPRKKPDNIKNQIIRKREYEHIQTVQEEVASFPYRPTKCKKTYRIIVLKKHLRITKGDHLLPEKIRYFFYITNDEHTPDDELVLWIDARCNQENTIAQLQSGVPAFHAPADTLLANWVYMVIASLAWNLKAWYGLLIQDPRLQHQIVQMEFKQFLLTFIQVPCQIIRTARQLIYRIANFTFDTLTFLDIFQHLKKLRFP